MQRFRAWLVERGRSPDTADLYARNTKLCLEDPSGPLARVVRGRLAPKTRRTNRAALCAWADFQKDLELRERLREVKMPPADRVNEKRALELDEWSALVVAIRNCDLPEVERQALLLVCTRGFRVGDVCRLDRQKVRNGLKSGTLRYLAKGEHLVAWTMTQQMTESLSYFEEQRGWQHVRDLIAPDWEDRQKGARLRLQRAFRGPVLEANLEVEPSLHILRRTYAWHFLQQCKDPVKLQKHMGWKSITTAMSYVDQAERHELDAVAAELTALLGV